MNGVLFSPASAYRSILTTDGGARIFHEFGLEVGKRHVSPFRPDATKKNFSVFRTPKGEVCFKDFVSGNGGTFTALLYQFGYTTFEAQIRFAASIYGVELKDDDGRIALGQITRTTSHVRTRLVAAASAHSSAAGRDNTDNQQPETNNQKPTNTYRVTALELGDFTPLELQILARISGGCITPDVLAKYGIRALRSYTDEGVSDKGFAYGGRHEARFTLVAPSADGNYYAYCYFEADKHSPFPHRAKNFHLKLHDYTADGVKFALGLAELRPNEAAIIVEGIKDCLILLARGYNAFTLGGVQHRLHPSVTRHLLKNGNTLAILFDTDFSGISAAQKLTASLNTPSTQHGTLNTQHLDLPRLARQETKDAPKPTHNDLADYVCQYGFDDALTALLAQPQLARRSTVQRGDVAVPALSMTVRRTLSEAPEHTAFFNAALDKHHRLALYAPTGCGKTYTLLRHIAPYRTGRTIFTVPTVALAEQIDREYGYGSDGYNADSAVGTSACKLVCITGKDDATTLMEARTSAKIIVCTYNSLHKVLFGTGKDRTTSLLDDDTLLVVDEAHKLHEEYGFRREAVLSVFNALRMAKHSLLMSATPSLLWHDDRSLPYTQLVVRVRERNTIRCQPLYYNPSSSSAAAIHAAVRIILHERASVEQDNGETGVIAVRLNNSKSLRAIQEALATLGIPAVNVDRITAKSRDTSDAYKSIMQHGRINVPIILTTSALDCGVNIYNTNVCATIVVDETNPNAIEQFANRFRRMDTVPLFVVNSSAKRQTTLPFPFAPKDYFERHALNAETQAQIYAHATGRDQPSRRGISSRSKFAELNDAIYWHRGEYVVNTPALIAATEALSLRSGRSFLDDLAHAGMTVMDGQNLDEYCLHKDTQAVSDNETTTRNDYHEHIAAATSAAHHHQQTSAHQHKALFFTMLAETPALLMETLWHTSFDAALKQHIGMLFAIAPRKQSEESKALARNYADLWLTNAPERRAKRYGDLRALHFDHTAASALCERFDDDRRWKNFMENLAMHQRLHLDATNGTEQPLVQELLSKHLLSKIDREKLRREKEIRAMVASSAEAGFVFEGATTRHIPNALHTKAAITERVNAFRNPENRLTKQQAGAIVSALFFCTYKRERKYQTSTFDGYYAFETADGGVRRKSLAEYLDECGVDGAAYTETWMRCLREQEIEDREQETRNMEQETYPHRYHGVQELGV